MFAFMQNKDLGDTFRETGIAFAYTISEKCGKELEELVHDATHDRLRGSENSKWIKKFGSFWTDYGADLMYKLSGMRDPTLNLIVNDPKTFHSVLAKLPEHKKWAYERLANVVKPYYTRLTKTYDSPSHAGMPRDKGFYAWDQFRFRDNFGVWYPIAWINWDYYLDANLDKDFATTSGWSTNGDGVFKEMKEFFYQIPRMAEKMAKDMWLTDTESINSIAEWLYRENIAQIRVCDGIKKIKADSPNVVHCSMAAMMLGMIDIVQLEKNAAPENVARFGDLKAKMKAAFAKAEKNPNFIESIPYREKMAIKFRAIVEGEIDTRDVSLADIENTEDMHDLSSESATEKAQKNVQAKSGRILTNQLGEFEKVALDPNKRTTNSSEEDGLPS